MALFLAGVSQEVPGTTVNPLCGSSLDAYASGCRAIVSGEASILISGGVESMSRAPFVMSKAAGAFARAQKLEDTTIRWRFANRRMRELYHVGTAKVNVG
jgi:acetyl-CoA acetyltransferase